ncbi:MAG TPA: DUF1996 domain-containing protein [Burkholderiaceae bacterium]|nr:DUF1996 domain-containing protein [Burkholderiaceae bacterium]
MKRLIPTILSLCIGVGAHAQFTIGSGASAPTLSSPISAMPSGKIAYDPATIPQRRAGKNREIIEPGTSINYYPPVGDLVGTSQGAWRISCRFSHISFDDPIVWPGRSGMTHMHQFFGNTGTRSASDLANMASSGSSTCDGGIANRTGYWAPVLIDTRNGKVVWAHDGNFYYKTAFDWSAGQWFPIGHRMIIGNPNAATEADNTDQVYSECYAGGTPVSRTKHLPTSQEGRDAVAAFKAVHGTDPANGGLADSYTGCTSINFFMGFPTCWDGVNLDSPDHISHMSYWNTNTTPSHCGGAFPVPLPIMTVNMHTAVNNDDLDYLRLSSDLPASSGRAAGVSLHTDRVEGFSRNPNFAGFGRTIIDIVMDRCLGRNGGYYGTGGAFDCHDDEIGSPLNNGIVWRLGE